MRDRNRDFNQSRVIKESAAAALHTVSNWSVAVVPIGSQRAIDWESLRSFTISFSSFHTDYSDVTHDPSAMHTFSYIYEELEFIFDGNVHPALETFIDVETLIRIYGKILVNSFAVQESGPLKRGGRSLRQIGRAVYLG